MKFRIIKILLLCCLTLTIGFLGCEEESKNITRPNGGTQSDTLATVQGVVAETDTENPIVGATVESDNGESTTSSDDGSYTFEVLEGERTISVTADDYEISNNTITVDGDSTYNLNFSMMALHATISGQVIDSASSAGIEDAVVAYGAGETATDRNGNYSFEVPAGTYTISITAADFNPKEETVAVTPGQSRTVNFTLALTNPEAGFGRVSGRVTNRNTRAPIEGARVVPARGDEEAMTDADGEYVILLEPGSRKLLANADDYDLESTDFFDIAAGEELSIDMTLRPENSSNMGVVAGVIIDAVSRAGLPEVRIQVGSETFYSRSNGTYERALLAGPYNVSVSKDGYEPASTVVQIEIDQRVSANFTLNPGGGGGEDAGTLTGNISNASNSRPLSGARISCGGASAVSNGAGNYTMQVDPGNYSASVTANGYNGAQRNVAIATDQTTTANFALIPGGGGGETGTISGVVREAGGNGIYLASLNCAGVSTFTGFGGEYTLQNVPTGNQNVTASAEGYTSANAPAMVNANQNTPNINFSLTPTGGGGQCRVSGTVKDSGGQGIIGATVSADSGERTSTGGGGSFQFDITAGNRTITASAGGFRPQSQQRFCDTNRSEVFNFVLQR